MGSWLELIVVDLEEVLLLMMMKVVAAGVVAVVVMVVDLDCCDCGKMQASKMGSMVLIKDQSLVFSKEMFQSLCCNQMMIKMII